MILKDCCREAYEELKENIGEWKNSSCNLGLDFNALDEKKAEGFIREYLRYREKYCEGHIPKSIHSVFVFLLGIYLWNEVFKDYGPEHKGFDYFEWLWFMTALYHDTKSDVESNGVTTNEVNQFGKMLYELYKNGEHKYTYDKKVVQAYFKYRLDKNKFDHGIHGGLVALDELNKNLKEKLDGQDEVTYEGMYFEKGDREGYVRIADAIISHNIWCVMEDDDKSVCEYKRAGLSDLIYKKDDPRRLSLMKNFLAFLLGLVDSIEPYKYFNNCPKNKDIVWLLDGIDVNVEKNCIILGMRGNTECMKCWYKEKLKQMEQWLTVKVDCNNCGGRVRIEI